MAMLYLTTICLAQTESDRATLTMGGCTLYSSCPIEHPGGVVAAAASPITNRDNIALVNATLNERLGAAQAEVASLRAELAIMKESIGCSGGYYPVSKLSVDTSGQSSWTNPQNVFNPTQNWHTDQGSSGSYVQVDLGSDHQHFVATHFSTNNLRDGLNAGQHYRITASFDSSEWFTLYDENSPGTQCAGSTYSEAPSGGSGGTCAFNYAASYRYYRVVKVSGSSGHWQRGIGLRGRCFARGMLP